MLHLDLDETLVDVDAPTVERIVDNLLTNVRRHTAPGTEVWITTRPSEEGVLLIVEDAGPGVPEADRADIFEPFRQIGQPSPRSSGSGIGLSVVAKFAQIHGGRAWVEDRPGGGSSFRVFLPTDGAVTSTRGKPTRG